MSISARNANRSIKVERNLLKDQIVELLRNKIMSGKIPQGTRLKERDIADILQVSRVPVRDALLTLEGEGLLEAVGSGRRVISLTEEDMLQLNRVRVPLEKLAICLFIENATDEDLENLKAFLDKMRNAYHEHALKEFIENDLNFHQYIWENTQNYHLVRVLDSIIGPMAMTNSANDFQFDWENPLEIHDKLIHAIKAKDTEAAQEMIHSHLKNSLERTLLRFEIPKEPEPRHSKELAAALLSED